MKIVSAIILCMALSSANAQTDIPKGFKKGSVILADNSILPGFIKDNIRSNASVTWTNETGQKKKVYNGAEILSAEIDGAKFICINGDFFSIISDGELSFLQKASDATGKVFYAGTDAIVSNGTEGRPGDYFIYNSQDKNLKLVSKKNFDEVVAASFKGNMAAIDKAKSANGEIAQLKEAVIVYNNRNNK
ncbi:MAG: hypothetical protein H7Y01_09450 [Ferruginibacter sp.]|nr:hypothetical protein [Chitinophagaceae bacterium]